MALPACFHLADEVFPRVRAEAARRLVASGWSQTQAAAALRVSQAMVSKYTSAAPETDPLAVRLAEDLHHQLLAPKDHPSPSWCGVLAPLTDEQSRAALADVLAAERLLRGTVPRGLLPQVGLNLARARPDAASADGVMAYPGRLVDIGGALVAPAPPVWGGSKHLAGLLLHLRSRDDGIQALANVRGGPDVGRALRRAGLPAARLGPGGDLEAVFRAAAAGKATPRLLHDEGRVGYEPCLYVAGPSAQAVAATILSIHDALVKP